MSVVFNFRVGFRHNATGFFICRQINHVVGYHAVHHFAVWAFNKPVAVNPRVGGKGVNQTDVRPFRRFNRADTSVMRRMHVADFKAGAVAGKSPRSQSRQAPFVRQFGQRIVLIHKLRQLRRTEELADNRGNRFGVDQILRLDVRQNFRTHLFANGSLHSEQPHTVLVFHQFADRTHTTVTQMVNIVNFAFAVA